jgi:hypothetical protein
MTHERAKRHPVRARIAEGSSSMTISRKGRRRIVIDDREFLWYVAEDVDNGGVPTLTIVSTDRRVFLRYALLQSDELRHVVVVGPVFRGVETEGTWRRFRSPQFGTMETIAPSDVRALVEWALAPDPWPQEVDWTGRPINAVGGLGRDSAGSRS